MIYNKRKKEIYKERKKSESLVFYDIDFSWILLLIFSITSLIPSASWNNLYFKYISSMISPSFLRCFASFTSSLFRFSNSITILSLTISSISFILNVILNHEYKKLVVIKVLTYGTWIVFLYKFCYTSNMSLSCNFRVRVYNHIGRGKKFQW